MTKPPRIESTNATIPVLAVTPFKADHDALGGMLPASEWTLHSARSVTSAMAQLKKLTLLPVVLCDSDVSPGSWREMLEHVLGMNRPPFMIVASRFADEQLWAEALNLGAFDVLAKPFHPTEVERTLASAWRRWCRSSDTRTEPPGATGRFIPIHPVERKRAAKANVSGHGDSRVSEPSIELLVIEPNVAKTASILDALEEAGLTRHIVVVSQDEALTYLRREDEYGDAPVPNLILLDWGLAEPSSREVLKEVRDNPGLAGIPTVLLWSSEHSNNPHEAPELGASCLIAKPRELSEFVHLCRLALKSGVDAIPLPLKAATAS
jgi:CheY-like chemotaxis protein